MRCQLTNCHTLQNFSKVSSLLNVLCRINLTAGFWEILIPSSWNALSTNQLSYARRPITNCGCHQKTNSQWTAYCTTKPWDNFSWWTTETNCHTRAALLQSVAATKKILSGQRISRRNRGSTLVSRQRKQIVMRAPPYYKSAAATKNSHKSAHCSILHAQWLGRIVTADCK